MATYDVCVYLLSLSFLGNLAPCSAFINLRGDKWRNFKRKLCTISLKRFWAVARVFYQYVVVMLQRIIIGKFVGGFLSKNNSLCVKKSIKKFIVIVYTLVTLFY
jgi:hypothetical protein